MTTIPADSRVPPLELPNRLLQVVNEDGTLTQYGVELLRSMRDNANGGNRVIPCNSSTTSNVITLTPNEASPIISAYYDYEIFVFTADATSSGLVTATVVPKTGALDTLKVYKTNGAAQATTSDIVQNSVYMLIYAEHLDTAAGGFVLK